MNPTIITLALFSASLTCGAIAYTHTEKFGSRMLPIFRYAIRFTFSGSVFLGVWASSSYAFWLMRVPLKIGTISNGKIADQWWLGPVCLIWAGLAYAELRSKDNN